MKDSAQCDISEESALPRRDWASACASASNQSVTSAARRQAVSCGAAMACRTRSNASASSVSKIEVCASSTLPMPHSDKMCFITLPCARVCTSTAISPGASFVAPMRADSSSRTISSAHARAAARCAACLFIKAFPSGSIDTRQGFKSAARALGSVCSHRRVMQSVEDKSVAVNAENPVAGVDQRSASALIHRERCMPAGCAARTEISVQIGGAETVDGLFGVAHQKERAARRKDALEDVELERVGVLEFVDQRGAVARLQDSRQRGLRVQCARQMGQQILIRGDTAASLEFKQRAGAPVQPVARQALPFQPMRALDAGMRLQQAVGAREKSMFRRASAFIQRLFKPRCAQQLGLAIRRARSDTGNIDCKTL